MKKPEDRVRPKLGDIIEIPLPDKRLAYVHYVKEHREPPGYGSLLRILPGLFDERPADMTALAAQARIVLCLLSPERCLQPSLCQDRCHSGDSKAI